MEGKKQLGNQVKEGTLSFNDLIYTENYFLTTIDIWLLITKYKIPTIFICQKTILQTNSIKNQFVGYGDLTDKFIFIILPSFRAENIPVYKLVNSNDNNIFISLDKLSRTCYPIIEEAINNKISIEDYIKQFAKLKKFIFQSESGDIDEPIVQPKPRPKPKHKSKLKLIYEEDPETYLTSEYEEGSLTKKSSEVGKPISSFVNESSSLSEQLSNLSLSEKPSSSSSSLKPSSLNLKPSSSSSSSSSLSEKLSNLSLSEKPSSSSSLSEKPSSSSSSLKPSSSSSSSSSLSLKPSSLSLKPSSLSEKPSSSSSSLKPSSSSSSLKPSSLSLKPSSLSLKPSSLSLKPSSSNENPIVVNPLSNLTIEIESETGVNPIIEIQREAEENPIIGKLISKTKTPKKLKKFIIKEDSD